MNCNEANQIPIESFLSSMGFEPARVTRYSRWYHSPLRNESTPSFVVDVRINKWFDHGIAKGGSLVDLGTRLTNLTVSDFLKHVENFNVMSSGVHQTLVSTSAWHVTDERSISHPALKRYLTDRRIPLSLASKHCKEVHYTNGDSTFYGIGLRNDSNGYEVRNARFKGTIGKKDISTINIGAPTITVYEGMLDFLSGLALFSDTALTTTIVLNSVNQVQKAIDRIRALHPERINCLLDNDESGRACFKTISEQLSNASDHSKHFAPYKDVNEFLCTRPNTLDKSITH
jgi:5S rRNA maturation endonuclease (ribonuclease M5)